MVNSMGQSRLTTTRCLHQRNIKHDKQNTWWLYRAKENTNRSGSENVLNLCSGPYYRSPCRVFVIRQFGDDFPKLCNEEAVSFDSESLQVLQNTQVCSARKVENDAVGEEGAMQRVRQAVMEYAASRVQGLGLPPTNLAAYETSDSSDMQRARASNASNVENDAVGVNGFNYN